MTEASPAQADRQPPVIPGFATVIREVRITMPDDIRLAATLYLPPDAGTNPVPVVLEYLPYRKDDSAGRNLELNSYLTRRGIAGARVDIRGTGNSEGELPEGEYTEQEQRDAESVIAWLAEQPWCTGSVGMWGISWGGFNSIQIAMRQPPPPALKAIIAVEASDDMFHDDVHYIDGLLHLDEYSVMIDQLNMLPPSPDYPLDEDVLCRRFDSEPWLLTWLGQQQDGPYWLRHSLRTDYSRLAIPAFLITGWWDGYRDSVFRMTQNARAPVRALIGPWNHTWPHQAVPGPPVEWRAHAVRWWEHWLKGIDTGMLDEPMAAVYVQSWRPPDPDLTELPGRWRSEDALPPTRTRYEVLYCGPGRALSAEPGAEESMQLRYVPSAGVEAGHWWGELTVDQRGADAYSLAFESAPLKEDLEILGFCQVDIYGGADASPLNWFARVSDVAPDGTTTLVAGGGRSDRADPFRDAARPIAGAGASGTADAERRPDWRPLQLHACSWVFPRGHRIRLAISNAMWPMIWPTPHPATATVRLGPTGTRLALPVVPATDGSPAQAPVFGDFEPSEELEGVRGWGDVLPVRWTLVRDDKGVASISWRGTAGNEYPWGRVVDEEYLRYEVDDDHPAEASARGEARTEVHLPDRLLIFSSVLDLDGDTESLRYRFRRELRKDGELIRERSWERRFRRDGH
ncbi:MAG TPA: CocE/NonD family hydrolase [Streptosporangiaceae bacterium]|nr:CocE/NonD family hydrolase [Streptosporangiaceae bacterium]